MRCGGGVSQALPDGPITAAMMKRMSEGSVPKSRAHAETFRTDRAGGERRRTTVGLTPLMSKKFDLPFVHTDFDYRFFLNF